MNYRLFPYFFKDSFLASEDSFWNWSSEQVEEEESSSLQYRKKVSFEPAESCKPLLDVVTIQVEKTVLDFIIGWGMLKFFARLKLVDSSSEDVHSSLHPTFLSNVSVFSRFTSMPFFHWMFVVYRDGFCNALIGGVNISSIIIGSIAGIALRTGAAFWAFSISFFVLSVRFFFFEMRIVLIMFCRVSSTMVWMTFSDKTSWQCWNETASTRWRRTWETTFLILTDENGESFGVFFFKRRRLGDKTCFQGLCIGDDDVVGVGVSNGVVIKGPSWKT